MKTRNILAGSAIIALAVTILLSASPDLKSAGPNILPFDDSRLYFEMNSTDEDLGIQIMLDGEPWVRLFVFNPNWRMLADIKIKGNARVVGLTELFTESAEPPLVEYTLQDWLALFPEGEYRFFGWTVEGEFLMSTADFTHNIPDGPDITNPLDESEVDPDQTLVVEWVPVADPNAPDSVIEAYQIIVEKDEDDERPQSFMIEMPATATSVTVPPEFLEADKEYKVEILAIETSDNQTITEISFETEE